jgi:hypothetical protein
MRVVSIVSGSFPEVIRDVVLKVIMLAIFFILVWMYGGGGYDIHVAIGKDKTYLRSEDGGCQNHKRDCAVTSH